MRQHEQRRSQISCPASSRRLAPPRQAGTRRSDRAAGVGDAMDQRPGQQGSPACAIRRRRPRASQALPPGVVSTPCRPRRWPRDRRDRRSSGCRPRPKRHRCRYRSHRGRRSRRTSADAANRKSCASSQSRMPAGRGRADPARGWRIHRQREGPPPALPPSLLDDTRSSGAGSRRTAPSRRPERPVAAAGRPATSRYDRGAPAALRTGNARRTQGARRGVAAQHAELGEQPARRHCFARRQRW